MNRSTRPAAFSLVEVTLALGIMTFCVVAIFGLLPTGLNTGRDAVAQTAAAGIAGAIAADLRQTPVATVTTPIPSSPRFLLSVPTPTTGQTVVHTLFLTENGSVATANPGTSAQDLGASQSQFPIYRATLVFTRPNAAAGDRTATAVRVLITWPASSDPGGGSLPQKATSMFETLIALDRN